jgi:hypothetical protein
MRVQLVMLKDTEILRCMWLIFIFGYYTLRSHQSSVLNPLKPKLVKIIFKNSVRTANKTQHFTITKINWLTLYKEIIAVYTENHTKLL